MGRPSPLLPEHFCHGDCTPALPWLPAALVGMMLAGAAVFPFHLTDFGVKGGAGSGWFAAWTLPHANPALPPPLLAAAAA